MLILQEAYKNPRESYMSLNMNTLKSSETLVFNDSVIDDVIVSMSSAFRDADVDELTLQQLKEKWRSKLQKSFQEDVTKPIPNMDNKKDAEEEPVPAQHSESNNSAKAVEVTSAVSLGIKWVLHEIELPQLSRSPRVQTRNMAEGHAKQLDGGLPSVKEETSEEEGDEVKDEMAETEASEDESLHSGDDLSEGDATKDDMFESNNVVACQYNKVSHYREKWKLELSNGVMHLNGKDYVFKDLVGEADW